MPYLCRISCDGKCGDEVELRVRHDEENYNDPACIHMSEIVAYEDEQSHVDLGEDFVLYKSTNCMRALLTTDFMC